MRLNRLAPITAFLALTVESSARAESADVRLLPGDRGAFGAWLVAGPYPIPKASAASGGLAYVPPGVDEATLSPRAGSLVGVAKWKLAFDSSGVVDVNKALASWNTKDQIAYAGAVLRVKRSGTYVCLFGTDDGSVLFLDGKPLFSRDEVRPMRNDDDFVRVALSAGDHPLVLKLRQRDEAWVFKARCVDETFSPTADLALVLPGTSTADADALSKKMVRTTLERGAFDTANFVYRPSLRVRFPGGYPSERTADLRIVIEKAKAPFFDAKAGSLSFVAGVANEFTVALPPLPADATDDPYLFSFGVNDETSKQALPRQAASERALVRARKALTLLDAQKSVNEASVASIRFLIERFSRLLENGDTDVSALQEEAKELDALSLDIESGRDPYETRTGVMRRALPSPLDGGTTEFGLYVPKSYSADSARAFPLVVALHGLNGMPMAMLRAFFGQDDPSKESPVKDRHMVPFADADAFVVAPFAYGNSMYRDLGEDDVMRVVDWVKRTYRIDANRVSVTGISMGGIGAAVFPFRFPDVFSASAPLCGYHSYLLRQDMQHRAIRPWERFLAEERSNVEWAMNGSLLPLYIVHGQRDLPVANSGVLIDAYEKLKYSVKHEHPDLGHNVWQSTYGNPETLKWLLAKARPPAPKEIRFRTAHARYGKSFWVTVDALAKPDAWGEVSAKLVSSNRIAAQTSGIRAMHFDRVPQLLESSSAVRVSLDGTELAFDPSETISAHFSSRWEKGPEPTSSPRKGGAMAGPFRDIFHQPIVFVYGASDPKQTNVNRDVANGFATIRGGMSQKYPILSDAEFLAKRESFDRVHSLFLVGNAQSNALVREFESSFPIRVTGETITAGSVVHRGQELGAAFIRPHPKDPSRYVVVVEGVDALGTLRALSLPELMPDFMIYDRGVAGARGQQVLGSATARSAGFFTNDWALP